MRRLVEAVKTTWQELGRWGRLALAGVGLSLLIALALGFWIPNSAKRHLLHGQTEIISRTVDDLQAQGLVPDANSDAEALTRFDQEVRLRLLGGDTVRVKVWTSDGVIVYSDEAALLGQQFELNPTALAALTGEATSAVTDVSEPAHALERHVDRLIEFYVPVLADDGSITGLFEVEEQALTLDATVGRIRRNTWLSIGIGLGVLTLFMVSLTLANAHVLARRRRQAEALLTQLVHAQEEERKRIVGSLHDDIGQPLYRILYGLQGSRARLESGEAVGGELELLEDLVRDVDSKLRGELQTLHQATAEDVGLEAALEELVEMTNRESDLTLELDLDIDNPPEPALRVALFRVAQEGVTNVRKHSGAGRAWIRVFQKDGLTVLEVRDDGVGPSGPEGLGLVTTRERLEALGGGAELISVNGTGTLLRAWGPIGRQP